MLYRRRSGGRKMGVRGMGVDEAWTIGIVDVSLIVLSRCETLQK